MLVEHLRADCNTAEGHRSCPIILPTDAPRYTAISLVSPHHVIVLSLKFCEKASASSNSPLLTSSYYSLLAIILLHIISLFQRGAGFVFSIFIFLKVEQLRIPPLPASKLQDIARHELLHSPARVGNSTHDSLPASAGRPAPYAVCIWWHISAQ